MASKNKSMISTSTEDDKRSPLEIEFQRLLKLLQEGEKEQQALEKKLSKKLQECLDKVQPLFTEWCKVKLGIALNLFEHLNEWKRKENQQQALLSIISEEIAALRSVPHGLNDEELEILQELEEDIETFQWSAFSDLSEEEQAEVIEEKEWQLEERLEEIRLHFAAEGLQVNLDHIDPYLSEQELRIELRKRIKIARERREREEKRAEEKAASRQVKSELDQIKQKGLAEIYKRLVKILHPDRELDEEKKLLKESWMKRLTVAYEENDLTTMLHIEAQWGNDQKETNEDKLTSYVALLRDQLKKQESSINDLINHPRYHSLAFFAQGAHNMLRVSIKDMQRALAIEETKARSLLFTLEAKDKTSLRTINGMIADRIS